MFYRKKYLALKILGGPILWGPSIPKEDYAGLVKEVQNQPLTDRGELAWIPFWQRLQRPTKAFDTNSLPDGSVHLLRCIPFW